MPQPQALARQQATAAQEPHDPYASNPVEDVEFLPGLGLAVVYVVLAYAFVSLMLLPVQTV